MAQKKSHMCVVLQCECPREGEEREGVASGEAAAYINALLILSMLKLIQAVLTSHIKNSDFYNNKITQEEHGKISYMWKEWC
jgi:hypothetical protein